MKGLKRLDGVDKVDVQLRKRDWGAEVTLTPGHLPDLERARDQIQEGEMKPRVAMVELTCTGIVTVKNGQFLFELDHMKRPASIVLQPTSEKGGEAAFAKVKEYAAQSPPPAVTLTGRWLPAPDRRDPALLTVTVIAVELCRAQ